MNWYQGFIDPVTAATRTTRPDTIPTIVDRARLYRTLDRWQSVRGIAVHAPAGYGKSSLVSRWIEVAAVDAPVLWLGLDDRDADSQHFLMHLARAVDPVVPGTSTRIRTVLEDRLGGLEHAFARFAAILEEAAGAAPMLVVLDDLHLADTPTNNRFLLSVLEYGPRQLHFILLARRRTGLNLARLIAHERVLTLDADDLRFRPAEIRAYLLNRGFDPPTDDELAELAARSEGWITALQLSVLAIAQRGPITALLQTLQGDRDWLSAFLAEEVLNRQTPAQRAFLLQTSILTAFNAELCAVVTGDDDAYGRLAAIARADLFLTRMHEEPGWFRYHQLFRELLQHQLHAQLDAVAVAALHRRAATWLTAADDVPAAVDHLLAAGAEEEAATLVSAKVRELLIRDTHRARRLVTLLPPALLRQRPRLMLDRCFLAVAVDDRRMGECLAEMGEVLAAERAAGRLQPELEAEWLVLQAAVAYRQGELNTVRMVIAEAADWIDPLPDHLAGVLAFLRVHIMRLGGNHGAAAESAADAIAAFDRAGFVLGTIAIRRDAALWSMRSGRPDLSAEQFAAIVRTEDCERHGTMSELAVAHLFAADNYYLCNRPADARAQLSAIRRFAAALQNEDLSQCSDAVEVLCALAETGTCTPPAIELEYTGMMSASLRLMAIDMATRSLTMLARGDDAWAMIQAGGLDNTGDFVEYQPRKLIPFLRAYLARGEHVDAVAGLIEDALVHATKIGERLVQLQLSAFAAWQHLQLGNEQEMERHLTQAVRLAQETGYVRVLLDIPALSGNVPELGRSALQPAQTDPRRSWPQADLTEQERRVLALLAAEQTYQEIAEELVISINTVRTHARHLYRKLGVKRRDQAIAVAQQRGHLSGQARMPTTSNRGRP